MRRFLPICRLGGLLPLIVAMAGCPHVEKKRSVEPTSRFAVGQTAPRYHDPQTSPEEGRAAVQVPPPNGSGQETASSPEPNPASQSAATSTNRNDVDRRAESIGPAEAIRRLEAAGAKFSETEDLRQPAIDLSSGTVGDDELAWLAKIPDLEQADLSNAKITDRGLEKIAELPRLEFLNLTKTAIGDAGLKSLKSLPRLKFLVLNGTEVSDDGLAELKDFPALEGVSLLDTGVSDAGIARLKKHLPDCTILFQKPASPKTEPVSSPETPVTSDQADDEETRAEEIRPINLESIEVKSSPAKSGPLLPTAHVRSKPAPNPKPARLPGSLEEDWQDPEFLKAVSRVYMEQKAWDKAVAVLEKADRCGVDDPALQYELGLALGRSGDLDRSFEKLSQVGGEAIAHYNLGIIVYENALGTSSEHFRKALILDPNLADAKLWLRHLDGNRPDSFEPEIVPARAVTLDGK